LSEGKLHRSLQVIDKANLLCPAQRKSTWRVELETLAEIGRYDAALALANAISSSEAPSDARAAVGKARALVAERNRIFPDTDEAKADMRKHWREAQRAARAGEHAKASKLFLQAWNEWRPNGGALYGAGRYAKLAGDSAAAQRLFDRAVEDLERTSETTLALDTPNGLWNPTDVAWSPNGRLLAVADRNIVIVNLSTGRERLRLPADAKEIAFSPDGSMLASASWDALLRDVSTGKLLRKLELTSLTSKLRRTIRARTQVLAVAFSPDGKTLAAASDDTTVRLWSTATGKLLSTLEGHGGAVRSVVFARLLADSTGASVTAARAKCPNNLKSGEVDPMSDSVGNHGNNGGWATTGPNKNGLRGAPPMKAPDGFRNQFPPDMNSLACRGHGASLARTRRPAVASFFEFCDSAVHARLKLFHPKASARSAC